MGLKRGIVGCTVKEWPLTNHRNYGFSTGKVGDMITESEMKGEEAIRHTVWRQNAPLHDRWRLERARTKCRSKRRWRRTVKCPLQQDTGFRKWYGGWEGERKRQHAWPLKMTQLHYFDISGIVLKRVGRVAQSVQWLTTGWTVRDRIPVGTRFSARPDRPLGAHLASCKMGTWSFPGVKCGRGVLLTAHPLPVPRSRKSRAITLPTL